jgi:hypothetical protein
MFGFYINASSLRTDPSSLKESRGDQASIKLSQHPVAFPLGFCRPSISISVHSYSQLVRRRTVVVRFAYLSFVVVAAPPNCGLRFCPSHLRPEALISTAYGNGSSPSQPALYPTRLQSRFQGSEPRCWQRQQGEH